MMLIFIEWNLLCSLHQVTSRFIWENLTIVRKELFVKMCYDKGRRTILRKYSIYLLGNSFT